MSLGNKNSLCRKVQSVGVVLVFFLKVDGCYYSIITDYYAWGICKMTGTDPGGGGAGGGSAEHY